MLNMWSKCVCADMVVDLHYVNNKLFTDHVSANAQVNVQSEP